MKLQMAVLVSCLAVLAVVVPLQAHHPFSAEYDKDKPVTMMGTVTKIDWANPHAHIFMDVKDDKGKVQHWDFELGGLKRLQDQGWKKDSLKTGDQITVKGWKASDGSNRGNADTIMMSNGTTLNAGSSFYDKGSKPVSN